MNPMFSAMLMLALLAAVPSIAQNHGGPGLHGTATQYRSPSPYSGMETRRVKALSDEQIADLEAGRGMGLALVAELNGYPGPSHVLELAEALGLTDEQERRTKELLDWMKAEAIPIGRRIIEEETRLNRKFAERKITAASLAEATNRIAVAQGDLRAAHLHYHLEMVEVLSYEQMSRYASLRGYASKAD
jgi:hypothetical protein